MQTRLCHSTCCRIWPGQPKIAGQVSAKAAAETGLIAERPVNAGAVDAAAEAVSAGVVEPGDLMIMYGSTMFFIQVTDGAATE